MKAQNLKGPANLRAKDVGPYTEQEHRQNRAEQARFNEAIQTRSRPGGVYEKSVFSQKSKVASIVNSKHPSVFGKPTFRDPQVQDIFKHWENKK